MKNYTLFWGNSLVAEQKLIKVILNTLRFSFQETDNIRLLITSSI